MGAYFGRRLKELRQEAGFSQAELGRRAGLSQNGISHWEAGDRDPSWPNVVALAKALGVTCLEFLEEPDRSGPRPVVTGGK